jgi:hypothetical protein
LLLFLKSTWYDSLQTNRPKYSTVTTLKIRVLRNLRVKWLYIQFSSSWNCTCRDHV